MHTVRKAEIAPDRFQNADMDQLSSVALNL
jgi:hypothetical protein